MSGYEKIKKWREENPHKHSAQTKRWRSKNPKKRNNQRQRYYSKSRDGASRSGIVWKMSEIRQIMNPDKPVDSVLALILGRTVQAIQEKRRETNKKG